MPTKPRTSVTVRTSRRTPGEEGGVGREQQSVHVPVLAEEVVEALTPCKTDILLDGTYGEGGHAKLLKPLVGRYVALDADLSVAERHENVITANFADLARVLDEQGVAQADKILLDLGWRRDQLASGRGFSFLGNEPLLMNYTAQPRSGFFARDILNTWSEQAIADVLFGYGEERFARRIARAVVERRERKPFETTSELVECIAGAVPAAYRRGRLHFATRSFQALRIAVNDEFGALQHGLRAAWQRLACGGRLAVISFHSAEDRIVKRAFAAFAKEEGGQLVYKKPVMASRQELQGNPAARSAKLRVIEKVCTA